MRTTLTVVDTVDNRLRRIAGERNISYKDVVNDALALGLEQLEAAETRPRYEVEVKDYGLKSGIDGEKLNQLVDELDFFD